MNSCIFYVIFLFFFFFEQMERDTATASSDSAVFQLAVRRYLAARKMQKTRMEKCVKKKEKKKGEKENDKKREKSRFFHDLMIDFQSAASRAFRFPNRERRDLAGKAGGADLRRARFKALVN